MQNIKAMSSDQLVPNSCPWAQYILALRQRAGYEDRQEQVQEVQAEQEQAEEVLAKEMPVQKVQAEEEQVDEEQAKKVLADDIQ